MRAAVASGAGVVALTAVLWWADRRVALPDVPLLYLPIVLAAAFFGVVPGVIASLASTLAFHVFFTAPQASLRVAATRDVASIVIYLTITVIITLLLSRARASAGEAVRRAEVAGALQRLASTGLALVPTDHPDRVAETVAASLGSAACAIWMREGGEVRLWGAWGTGANDSAHTAAAAWAERQGRTVGVTGFGGTRLYVVPVVGAGDISGALTIEASGSSRRFLADPDFVEGLSGLVTLFWARAGTAARELEAAAARRSDELKSALLSMVSHELRTPLTVIRAAVDDLLHAAGPDEPESLTAIQGETDRLTRLVRNLLDASRIEAGQLRPAAHPVRLRRLVGELVDRHYRSEADAPRLDIPATIYVEADPVLVSQVFLNLFENAQRYGKPPVVVDAEPDEGLVRIRVSDHGPGVPDEALGRIFDRFVRLGRGGLGLGLALCRAIVEAHGGTIQACASPDRGLIVTFTLPAAQGGE